MKKGVYTEEVSDQVTYNVPLTYLEGLVAALSEEGETVVDERLIEQNAGALQEVAAVASDLSSWWAQ